LSKTRLSAERDGTPGRMLGTAPFSRKPSKIRESIKDGDTF